MATLTGLYVYPVKSARGIALAEAELSDRGLRHDRRFMVVDTDGRFVTQRELPRMARLVTALADDALALSFAGVGALSVPLVPTSGHPRSVRVFSDRVEALDLGGTVAEFLSAALEQPVSLVYMPDDTRRQVDPTRAGPEDIVGFADGFPYLLASESSLDALNRELREPVPMERFRPNFVVAGLPAYAEDALTDLTIGDVRFRGLKPCSRCVIVDTDPRTGERAPGPLAALVRTHTRDKRPMFGQNLVARGRGRVRRGDVVTLPAHA